MRLNKYISASGFCSRRKADEWIASGKVKVNGNIADMGMQVEDGDVVTINGKNIEKASSFKMVAFYKPKGYAVTFHRGDKSGIFQNFPIDQDLRYIGRLDKDSEGLLLLTNDGDLCNEISKARNYHEKEYVVRVNKPVTDEVLERMSKGVRILDGNKEEYVVTRPCEIKRIDDKSFSIILTQGYNRQIRRMCEYFDLRVVHLKRIRVMNILLADMEVGEIRSVSQEKVQELRTMIANKSR